MVFWWLTCDQNVMSSDPCRVAMKVVTYWINDYLQTGKTISV